MSADELFRRYEEELSFLRKGGREFAEAHRKEAGRIGLDDPEHPDPHVDRLIQSVALIGARLRTVLENRFDQLAESLVEVVFPGLLAPLPSMTIARFTVLDEARVTSRYTIPRGSTLLARTSGDESCRFRTCYETVIWPLELDEVVVESPAKFVPSCGPVAQSIVSRVVLRFRCTAEVPISELGLDRLCFNLGGVGGLGYRFYELLLRNAVLVEVSGEDEEGEARVETLGPRCLEARGFGSSEALLPECPRAFAGFRLLSEWFAFPEKFLFVDLTGLERATGSLAGDRFEISIFFDARVPGEGVLKDSPFRLGCTPAINLFPVSAEPILVDFTRERYKVYTKGAESGWVQPHSIIEVTGSVTRGVPVEVVPLHSVFSRTEDVPVLSWNMERVGTKDGSQSLWVRLGLSAPPGYDPQGIVLSPKILCTNGDAPRRLPLGEDPRGDFFFEGMPGFLRVTAVQRPTSFIWRDRHSHPASGTAEWLLVEHLALNYMSLLDGSGSNLVRLLDLYERTGKSAVQQQVHAIRKVRSQRADRLVDGMILRGTDLDLTIDEDAFEGGGLFCFAKVLSVMFGMYAPVNSFVRLTARSAKKHEDSVVFEPRVKRQVLP